MKILAISDIHGDRTFMKKMAEKGKSERVDLVVIAGDILEEDMPKPGLIQPFKDAGLEVALLPGNHEGDPFKGVTLKAPFKVAVF